MNTRIRPALKVLPACLVVALLLTSAVAGRAPARVVAVGDVHGAYAEFVAVLQRTGLIDTNRQWTGGAATLVQIGDALDRGSRSRECLDLLMDLERQAPRDGGTVVPLLGNHEFMNVIGDLRYVTPEIFLTFAAPDSEKTREQAYKEYVEFLSAHSAHAHAVVPPADEPARKAWMDAHPPGFIEHREAFGPNGKYGQWIRAHHAVVQIGDGLFVHGGLNPALEFGSVRELDDRVMADVAAFDSMWRALVDAKVIWRYMTFAEAVRFTDEELTWLTAAGKADVLAPDPAMTRLLGYKNWITVSAEGPLWYRGLAAEPEEKLIVGVKAMLERLQAQYIVVGHTVESKLDITPRFESRVFLLDTGMLKEVYGGRASALEIQNGSFTARYAEGEPKALPAPASGKTESAVVRQPGR
jgi:hypothetical protein